MLAVAVLVVGLVAALTTLAGLPRFAGSFSGAVGRDIGKVFDELVSCFASLLSIFGWWKTLIVDTFDERFVAQPCQIYLMRVMFFIDRVGSAY